MTGICEPFEGFPPHPVLKKFVYDYDDRLNGIDTRQARKSRDHELPILDKVPLDKAPEPIARYVEPVREYVESASELVESILANR